MKSLALVVLLFVSNTIFSQNSNHGVKLNEKESFEKISISQIVDSVNINQNGTDQFEYLEIVISQSDIDDVDKFMKNCKSVGEIIKQFGEVNLDIVVMPTNSNKIHTLSGFYYSVSFTGALNIERPTLSILYPRTDKML
jgi:hypothetical protein